MPQLRTVCKSMSRCNAERVPFRAGPPFLKFPMYRLQKSPSKLRRCCSATSTHTRIHGNDGTKCNPVSRIGRMDTYGDPWTRVAELALDTPEPEALSSQRRSRPPNSPYLQ